MIRELLIVLGVVAGVTTTAIGAMIAVATDAVAVPAVLVASGAIGAAIVLPAAVGRRGTRERRLLRARVGDPSTLTGTWRRHLATAWLARDEYAGVASDLEDSPLGDHVVAHQLTIDAALERCGVLARDGDRLSRQARRFRADRLRHDLSTSRRRDPDGAHTLALAARLAEVEGLRRSLDDVRASLEEHVHDLRTAVWRATQLRTAVTLEPDTALHELLEDLARLRAALDEVDVPSQQRSGDDISHDVAAEEAPAPRARYDM